MKGIIMSYQYGVLTRKKTNNFDGFTGSLTAPFFVGDVYLKPVEKRNDDSPDYYIMTRQGYPIGKAWEKTAKKTGVVFMSITFDMPELDKVVYCSAFYDEQDAKTLNIVWNRPKKKDDAVDPLKMDSSESLDDTIPLWPY